MAVSYNKLWKLLVDKKMSKADLMEWLRLIKDHIATSLSIDLGI